MALSRIGGMQSWGIWADWRVLEHDTFEQGMSGLLLADQFAHHSRHSAGPRRALVHLFLSA